MEEELTGLLKACAPLTDLVADRIDWGASPQSAATPRVVLTRIGGRRLAMTEGATGLVESRVQVDVWGATYEAAKMPARAIVAALDGRRFAELQTPVQGVFVALERDSYEGESPDRLFRTMLDLLVWHREPTA